MAHPSRLEAHFSKEEVGTLCRIMQGQLQVDLLSERSPFLQKMASWVEGALNENEGRFLARDLEVAQKYDQFREQHPHWRQSFHQQLVARVMGGLT